MGLKDIFERAAEDICGTCMIAEEALTYHTDRDDLIEDFYDYLDANNIVMCDCCSWWSYSDELTEGLCTECSESNEYDE